MVLRNQSLPFTSNSVNQRFAIVDKIEHSSYLTVAAFLDILGLGMSDARLWTMRTKGRSILHYVASRLPSLRHQSERTEWASLAVRAIQNGVSPNTVAQSRSSWHDRLVTPLIECLVSPNQSSECSICRQQEHLQMWGQIVADAGHNPLEYIARAQSAWTALGMHKSEYWGIDRFSPPVYTYPARLICGSSVSEWRLEFQRTAFITVHKMVDIPGSFPRHRYLPLTICWDYDDTEEDETEHWAHEKTVVLHSKPFVADACSHRPSIEALGFAQDDAGSVVSKIASYTRSRRSRPHKQRSNSLPPPEKRSVVISQSYSAPQWLEPDYMNHTCGASMRCIKGKCWWANMTAVQEGNYWLTYSFLSEILQCQQGFRRVTDLRSDFVRHSGGTDCSQGCDLVHLDKLNVPEPLLEYHPRL